MMLIRCRRPLSLSSLDRILKLIPLGLLWGIVAGGLQVYRYISTPNGFLKFDFDLSSEWSRVELVLFPIIGAMASALLIAVFLGSTLFNRGISAKRWVAERDNMSIMCRRRRRFPAMFPMNTLDACLGNPDRAMRLSHSAVAPESGVQIGMVSAVKAIGNGPALAAGRLILRQSGDEPAETAPTTTPKCPLDSSLRRRQA